MARAPWLGVQEWKLVGVELPVKGQRELWNVGSLEAAEDVLLGVGGRRWLICSWWRSARTGPGARSR